MDGRTDLKAKALAMIAEGGVVSARTLRREGIPGYVLTRLLSDGRIERVGHGYYGDPERTADLAATRAAAVSERLASLAETCGRLPPVVVLHTAAVVHGLTDDNRIPEVWLAVMPHSRLPAPTAAGLPVRAVQMDDALLCIGVEPLEFGGRTINVTDRERTIVDLLRYTKVHRRNGVPLVTMDAAMEALERGLGIGADPERIADIARGINRAGWVPAVVEEMVRRTGYGF